MKHATIRYFGTLTATLMLLASPAAAGGLKLKVQGQACHGANVFNNEVLTDYANTESFLPPDVFAFWNTVKVNEIGVVDPDPAATNAQVITASTPLDSVMGTYIIPGYTDLSDFDPDAANKPIHNSYLEFDLISSERAQLPLATPDLHKFTPVRNSNQAEPITLRQWNKATGQVGLKCFDDGTGSVSIRAKHLIPHLAYTAWQVFAVTDLSQLPFPEASPIAAQALGGAPNYLVADARGRATFKRELNYCPLELENPLMYIALLAHWDHSLYGASPDGFGEGWAAGLVAADQLCFPTGNHLLEAR